MSDQYFKLFNPTDAQGTILKPQFGISITLSPKEESKPLPTAILPEIKYYVDAYKWEVKDIAEQPTPQDTTNVNSSELKSEEVPTPGTTETSEVINQESSTVTTETNDLDSQVDETVDEVLTKKYTEDELNSLYKPDVVNIAEKRGLNLEGNKAELIAKILEAQGA